MHYSFQINNILCSSTIEGTTLLYQNSNIQTSGENLQCVLLTGQMSDSFTKSYWSKH